MITGIKIANFKALKDFCIENLPKLVCLIGMNGAGKSSLLQALDFVAASFSGGDHFRDWKGEDILNGQAERSADICFELKLALSSGKQVSWGGEFSIREWKYRKEWVKDADNRTLLYFDGAYLKLDSAKSEIDLQDSAHKGSVFSTRKFEHDLVLKEVKEEIMELKSLELLSPDELRRGSRTVEEISLGGAGLPGFIKTLKKEKKLANLVADLQLFYPSLRTIEPNKPGPGWFGFDVSEVYGDEPKDGYAYVTGMKHVNDGFLRILAIVSQKYTKKRIILFDEIENGVNQELIAKLVDFLITGFDDKTGLDDRQIFITTHSALVLNYLNDEMVRDGVVLLYRDKVGATKGVKFFEIEGMYEKLGYLNAGQVMAATDLVELNGRLP